MNSDVDFEIGKNVNTGMIKNSDKDIQQSIVIDMIPPPNIPC